MPAWVAIYFAAYATFTLWSIVGDLKSSRSHWVHPATELTGDTLLVVCALGYWLPKLGGIVDEFGLFMLAAGASAFLLALWRECAEVLRDPELSPRERLAVLSLALPLVCVVGAPALYWAYTAAIGGVRAVT